MLRGKRARLANSANLMVGLTKDQQPEWLRDPPFQSVNKTRGITIIELSDADAVRDLLSLGDGEIQHSSTLCWVPDDIVDPNEEATDWDGKSINVNDCHTEQTAR